MTVTENSLLDGRVRLRQPAEGYRVAIDPVLLAAAVPARPGDRVLDAGCGTGAAALCLNARVPGTDLHGLERDPDAARLARENAMLNQASLTVAVGDIARPPLRSGAYHHVLSNPPFHARSGTASPDAGRDAAHREDTPLADWIGGCLALLRPKGRLTVIHRADRLDALLALLHGRAGAVVVLPLWPRAGVSAKRVIVSARQGVATPARLLPGLVLHGAEGGYTDEAEAVLRGAQPIPILQP